MIGSARRAARCVCAGRGRVSPARVAGGVGPLSQRRRAHPPSSGDALDLIARVTATVSDAEGEDGVLVSASDHGGAGGRCEFTGGDGFIFPTAC